MSLARHASAVAALTLSSRVLGFVRDAAVAALFGVGTVGDSAVAGLAIPQLARRLLGEAALNGAVVPGLVAAERAEGAHAARQLGGAALALAVIAAGIAAGALYVFMPQTIAILAPGFGADGARADGAVLVGRLAVVCLPLMAAAGVLAAAANASGRVRMPALSPVIGNIAVLIVLGALLLGLHGQIAALIWLAAATVVGAAAQLGLMLVAISGCRLAPRLPTRAALALARPMLVAAAPSLLASALPQLRFLIAGAAASGTVGGVAALFYASRLIELPLGVIGASAGAVLLPALAAQAREQSGGDPAARGIEATLALALPATFGLIVLAGPIVVALFRRGAFEAGDVAPTALALALLALALPLQAVEKILAAIAFAHGFGRIATRAGVSALILGGGAGFVLAGPLGIAGPALGVLASSLIGLAGLGLGLARHGLVRLDPAARRRLPRLLGAAVVMAVAVGLLGEMLAGPLAAGGMQGLATLAFTILAGVAVYAGIAHLTGGIDVAALRAALRGRM